MKFPPLYTPVRVKWFDTTEEPGWHYLHEGEQLTPSPRLMITRGVLAAVGENSITVTGTFSPRMPEDLSEGHLAPLTIPVGCIDGVKVIE